MRLIVANATNFASYKQIAFDFNTQGLTLIQGATGSGKSTLCDLIPWILWGRTAKDGAVDEIRTWSSDELTTGTAYVEHDAGILTIVRTRGPKAKDNDLFYLDGPNTFGCQRGKDLLDTQRLINNLLGMDFNLYTSGAYYSEFSQTAQFFQTTAKNRRTICEQLVDLTLAKNLEKYLTAEKKTLDAQFQKQQNKTESLMLRIDHAKRPNDYQQKSDNFENDKANTLACLTSDLLKVQRKCKPKDYADALETELWTKLNDLTDEACKECGTKLQNEERITLKEAINILKQETVTNERYHRDLAELKKQIQTVKDSVNGYQDILAQNYQDYKEALAELEANGPEYARLTNGIFDIELLQDVNMALRGELIKNTIQELEVSTNKLLANHFDAEIRVLFEVVGADKLDVQITKNGNVASYTQLSKGQRCLLKLCFGVSVQQVVANRHGLNFNCLFFDEALDGMSEEFKLKAYGLFQTLTNKSVFVVEHSTELKASFTNSYTVTLVNGHSQIEKT